MCAINIRFLIVIFKEGVGNGVWYVLLHYLAEKMHMFCYNGVRMCVTC